jgi:NAD(P)-dependent dehydrogenase (short-subunit alcohol dehydrogenase family)
MHRDQDNRKHNRNIVNVSSLAGSRVFAGRGQGVYAASKAALNQLTRHLASEFAVFGVRVNAVAPNSFPAIISTDSVAHAIARLDAESVTGRILALDAEAAS